jgi:hypothetical protein
MLLQDDFRILWIENIVDAEVILSRNTASIHTSPDFTNDEDFIQRIKFYKDSYESVEDSEGMYIKVSIVSTAVKIMPSTALILSPFDSSCH